MAGRTVVSIYSVGDGGGTGDRVGSGELIDPEFVLVDKPTGEELGQSRRLRVGVAPSGAATDVIDVIDVKAIHPSEWPPGDDSVGLELEKKAVSPISSTLRAVPDEADPPTSRALPKWPPSRPPGQANPFCRMFPHAPFC